MAGEINLAAAPGAATAHFIPDYFPAPAATGTDAHRLDAFLR